MAGDLGRMMQDLDCSRLERASGRTFTEVEQTDQLQALVGARAIEQLNDHQWIDSPAAGAGFANGAKPMARRHRRPSSAPSVSLFLS